MKNTFMNRVLLLDEKLKVVGMVQIQPYIPSLELENRALIDSDAAYCLLLSLGDVFYLHSLDKIDDAERTKMNTAIRSNLPKYREYVL